MFRSIIWDVDGTLLDTYPSIVTAFVDALRSHGRASAPERVAELARVGLGHCARALAEEHGLDEGGLSEEFAVRYGRMPLGDQAPFPLAAEVCRAVRACGGLNTIVTHRGRESTRRLLEVHGLTELFHTIVSVEDGYPKKPDPAAFHALLSQCELDRAVTLAIGDREIDVRAGKAAGLVTALYGDARSDPEPDLRIRSYGELLPRIGDKPRSAS